MYINICIFFIFFFSTRSYIDRKCIARKTVWSSNSQRNANFTVHVIAYCSRYWQPEGLPRVRWLIDAYRLASMLSDRFLTLIWNLNQPGGNIWCTLTHGHTNTSGRCSCVASFWIPSGSIESSYIDADIITIATSLYLNTAVNFSLPRAERQWIAPQHSSQFLLITNGQRFQYWYLIIIKYSCNNMSFNSFNNSIEW